MCKENSRTKYEVAIAWFLKSVKKTVLNLFPFVFYYLLGTETVSKAPIYRCCYRYKYAPISSQNIE